MRSSLHFSHSLQDSTEWTYCVIDLVDRIKKKNNLMTYGWMEQKYSAHGWPVPNEICSLPSLFPLYFCYTGPFTCIFSITPFNQHGAQSWNVTTRVMARCSCVCRNLTNTSSNTVTSWVRAGRWWWRKKKKKKKEEDADRKSEQKFVMKMMNPKPSPNPFSSCCFCSRKGL